VIFIVNDNHPYSDNRLYFAGNITMSVSDDPPLFR
jgi:hypothetical protein